MRVKTYVVSQGDSDGGLTGKIIAVKLTFEAAKSIARKEAPAKVEMHWADKFDHYTQPTS